MIRPEGALHSDTGPGVRRRSREVFMKKQLFSLICLLLGAALGIGCFLFIRYLSGGPSRRDTPDAAVVESEGVRNEELARLALNVAETLRQGDYKALSEYVHPVYGLVFSPYSTINLSSNQCFTANRVAIVGSDTNVYTWGTKVDSDEPIQLTAKQYFETYVYDRDYGKAPIIGFNIVVRSGNALENLSSVFPDAQFVDLYFPPEAPEGTDWSILRMVFEDADGTLRLSALIHSEYTE